MTLVIIIMHFALHVCHRNLLLLVLLVRLRNEVKFFVHCIVLRDLYS